MILFPAIDLKDGKCVRLLKGDFSTVHQVADDPLETAKRFREAGAEWVHMVDLDGAKDGVRKNSEIVKKVCEESGLKVELGGGIRSMTDLETVFRLGASRCVIGSAAVFHPEFVKKAVERYGDRIAVGIDALHGKVKTAGWVEDSGLDDLEFARKMEALGVKTIIYTDIATDGALSGPSLEKLIALRGAVSCQITASGGVSCLEDLMNLAKNGMDGAVVGKAYYAGTVDIKQAVSLLQRENGWSQPSHCGTPSDVTGALIPPETKHGYLAKRIIPCLDVKDGRVVKGVNFVSIKDAGDPAELAKFYSDQGADEVVFLDITATSDARKSVVNVIERTGEEVFVPLTVGGGIRTVEDFQEILRAGADKISVNSAAVKHPDLISQAAQRFGSQCVVLAIDGKSQGDGTWEVVIAGGRTPTGIDVVEWAKQGQALGAGEILLTSMDADGTQTGFDLEMTKAVVDAVSIPVIASGGAGTLRDFYEVFDKTGCDAALAASLFHYGTLTVPQVKEYLKERGIPVRL